MFNYHWKKELLTVPNLLSFFRLLLIPVYTGIYLNASSNLDYYLAGSVLTVSCLTDLADGKIARECHMITNLGKLLDPLADKLTQFSLFLALAGKHRSLYPLMMLFLTKEIFQLAVMIMFMKRGRVLAGALFAGKLCTTVLFISFILMILFPWLSSSAVQWMIRLDAVFMLFAFYSYIQAYFGPQAKLTDMNGE